MKNQSIRFMKKDSKRIVNISNAIKNKWRVVKQVLIRGKWINRKSKIYKKSPELNRQIVIRNMNNGRFISRTQVENKQRVSFELISGGGIKDRQIKVKHTKDETKRKSELIKSKKKRLKGETKLRKYDAFFKRNFHSAKIRKFYIDVKIQQRVEKEFKSVHESLRREIENHVKDTLADWMHENKNEMDEMDKTESRNLINSEISKWITYHKRMI